MPTLQIPAHLEDERSRLVNTYRILYIVGGAAPEVIGVLHTARDISSERASRLQ